MLTPAGVCPLPLCCSGPVLQTDLLCCRLGFSQHVLCGGSEGTASAGGTFTEMGDSARVLEAEQHFTSATVPTGHTRPQEAVLPWPLAPAKTRLLQEQQGRRQELSPPLSPASRSAVFVSSIPTTCVAHRFEALERRMCAFSPAGYLNGPVFPDSSLPSLDCALCGGVGKAGSESSVVRTDEGLA